MSVGITLEEFMEVANRPVEKLNPKTMTNRELAQLRFTFVNPEEDVLVSKEIKYRREHGLTADDYKRE